MNFDKPSGILFEELENTLKNDEYETVKSCWKELSDHYLLSSNLSDEIWSVIDEHYNESQRYYHTFSHISTLINLSNEYAYKLTNISAVKLSILFHDLIYEPAQKDNEEKSAILFKQLLMNHIPEEIIDLVFEYILLTKEHKVKDSLDQDLKYFIDFDMSILGAPTNDYIKYAKQIRKEYIHIPLITYCKTRSEFLNGINIDEIFSNEEFKALNDQVKVNIEFECKQLSQHIVIS